MSDQGYRIGAVLAVAAPDGGGPRERQTVDYELVDPTIARFHGRVLSLSPARTLVEFAEVGDALAAGLELQRGMAERNAKRQAGGPIELGLGVDLGELFERQGQLQGTAIAARLAKLARPGEVALSEAAYRHLRAKTFAAEFTPRRVDQPQPTDLPVGVIDARPITAPGAQSPWIVERHWSLLAGVGALVMLLMATLVLWRPVVALLLGSSPAGDAP
jgi:hypothetical protein